MSSSILRFLTLETSAAEIPAALTMDWSIRRGTRSLATHPSIEAGRGAAPGDRGSEGRGGQTISAPLGQRC